MNISASQYTDIKEKRQAVLRRAVSAVAGVAFLLWLSSVVVSCAELYAKQRTEWLQACQADGNKAYQCLERWEHMQRGGE